MDSRLYRCRVSNDLGTACSESVSLSVVGFTEQPADQAAASGATVVFSIAATGSPSYQWQYSKDNGKTWTDCTSNGCDAESFSFKAKASMDGRLYRCVLTKGDLQVRSSKAKLTVTGASSAPAVLHCGQRCAGERPRV